MNASSPRLGAFNLFVHNLDTLPEFYRRLLGFAELDALRSPIFRALDAGGIVFGFNLDAAYDLLGVGARRPGDTARMDDAARLDNASARPVYSFHTFEVGSADEVRALADKAAALGGTVVKPPYDTYYAAVQTVLTDPEDNVFRLNHYLQSPW
jgi:uncharacterized glyoxalase superfamily protein PhnB